MGKKTVTQCLVDGLLKLGMKEVKSKNKYRMFTKDIGGYGFYLVGKAGALRFSNRGTSTMSTPVLESFRRQILEKGQG